MLDPSLVETYLRRLAPEQLQGAITGFLPKASTRAEQVAAIEAALRSPAGPVLRAELGRWILHQIVPVEALVPEEYIKWRPPVRDAMLFVISHLSNARLAPKILEQIELPKDTPPEIRLLKLISKVPGLQKLGQVIARNRHLRPALRQALSQLENGIQDVTAEDICALIQTQLGGRIGKYDVDISPAILSEASVSAVVRFTWLDANTGQRQRGVFKVLKPHIATCFAEDMELLQQLAAFFGARHREYGFARHVLTDTFTKVRRLLQHEVDFPREQQTLVQACSLYRSISGVRVPRLIQPLCTSTITAITEEFGAKITDAVANLPAWRRAWIAGQMIDALIAVPLLAAEPEAMFHADPHAGNLLYNNDTGELVILDWALTERLNRDQRRHLALLFFMLALRDPVGVRNEVEALRQRGATSNSRVANTIRDGVTRFLDELPINHVPGLVDAMRLLERIAVKGVRFPAPLIMMSKSLFTLDGILDDIGGSDAWRSFSIARHIGKRWLSNRAALDSPLTPFDWIAVQCSGLLFSGRLWVQWEQMLVDRVFPAKADAGSAES